jgi:hypothetical protein
MGGITTSGGFSNMTVMTAVQVLIEHRKAMLASQGAGCHLS